MVYVLDEAQVKKTRDELSELESNFLRRIQQPPQPAAGQESNFSLITHRICVVDPSKNWSSSPNTRSAYDPSLSHMRRGSPDSYSHQNSLRYSSSPPNLYSSTSSISSNDIPQHVYLPSHISMSQIQSGGENVDWYRVFEGIKSMHKDHSYQNSSQQQTSSSAPFSIVSLNPRILSSSSSSSGDDQVASSPFSAENRTRPPQCLHPMQPIHLDPVKVFLSSTIEPTLKKRKLLPEDTTPAATDNGIGIGPAEEDDDPLEKYVNSYVNSKPFGM
jgi:hypothetical protein